MLELMAGDDGGDGGDVLAGALDSPDARAVEVGLHGLAQPFSLPGLTCCEVA